MAALEIHDQAMRNASEPTTQVTDFRDASIGAEKLYAIPVFRGFSKAELQVFYNKGEIISLKPKSYAVIEGEPTRGLFIILQGQLSVYKNESSSGSMHRIAHLEAGQSFGEFSLFDTASRSASVAAETMCHLFHLEVKVFESVIQGMAGDAMTRFYKSCTEELVKRFRKLNGDYVSLQQLMWQQTLKKKD